MDAGQFHSTHTSAKDRFSMSISNSLLWRGLLAIVIGVVSVAWPGITALVLTVWVGIWAVVTGIVETAVTFQGRKMAGERALWMLSGLVSVAFGIVLFIRPDIGALSLATVFGLYAIVYGVSVAVLSFQTRKVGSLAHELVAASDPRG
jgi:uncharacterized membrane protein HdeD (DUF308 family)